MTVEEIEIIVTAKVTEALKEFMKILPTAKQIIKQVQDVFNTIDTSAIEKSMKKILSSYSKTMKKIAKDNEIKIKVTNDEANKAIDETEKKLDSLKKKTTAGDGWKGFNSSEEAGDISGIKINGLDSNEYTKEINKIKEDIQEISETEIRPKIQQDISGNIKNKNSISEETSKVDIKPSQENISMWDIFKSKIEQIKPAIEQIKAKIKELKQTKVLSIGNLDINFKPLINQIDRARAPLDNFMDEIKRAKAEGKSLGGIFLSKVGGSISKLPGKMKGFISSISNTKSQLKGLSNISINIKNSFSSMTKGIKGGFAQILKYAGALLSIQGIYSTLRSCASSWLSSQNAGAKQLSANIEYMKYAMGSALAPVIQFVTNLVYKLMKAIQSVAYVLTGVNIFAKASASSMGNVASNAKKAKNETKQLAGIHDEINNISNNDSGSGSGGGSGTVAPDFDLSNIDINSNLIDMIKNGDWYKIGETVAEKINESLASINWDKIQNTAKNIASNIGNFINGFVEKLDWNLVGSTIGNGINTALIFVDTLLTTIKWDKIGTSIANMLNSAIKTTKWNLVGKTIADAINGAVDLAYNFVTQFQWEDFGENVATGINKSFREIKWDKIGKTLSEGIKGVFNGISKALQEVDWQSIGDDIADCVMSIDWGRVVASIFKALGSFKGAKVGLIKGFWDNMLYNLGLGLQNIMDQIEDLGLNIFQGILYGILYSIGGIGQWIVNFIFKPFINGFKSAFGIHSPSTVMQKMGNYIIERIY